MVYLQCMYASKTELFSYLAMEARRHPIRIRKVQLPRVLSVAVAVFQSFALQKEIVYIFRRGFIPFAASRFRRIDDSMLLFHFAGLILQENEIDSLAGFLQHVRIEREERVQTFLRRLGFIFVDGCQLSTGIAFQDRVTVGQLVGTGHPRKGRRHRRQANSQRIEMAGNDG